MKNKLLTISFTLLGSLAFAQPWMRYVDPQSTPNFFTIQKAFRQYEEEHLKELEKEKREGRLEKSGSQATTSEEEHELPGFEVFKRWEWFWEARVDSAGNFPDPQKVWNEFLSHRNAGRMSSASEPSANWELMGPYQSIPSSGGGMGRVNFIRFNPQNANDIWIGTPAGGLWRSLNGGDSWLPTTTDNLPVIGSSDLLIDPINPQVMYLATGDAPANDTYSLGVLKSTDGGQTWNPSGLSFLFTQKREINRLVFFPGTNTTLFACTGNNLLRSNNAAANWSVVTTGNIKDIEFKPGSPSTVYISTNASVRVSTDSGQTFTTVPSTSGLPTTDVGRIELAISPANPNALYALVANSSDNGYKGLYVSINDGQTWEERSTSPNLLGWDSDGMDQGGQAFFTLSLAVDPSNAEKVFTGGVNVYKSGDGAVNFFISSHWYGANGIPYAHADIHDIQFKPGNPSVVYLGTDGGVFRSNDGGNTYTDLSVGLAISQFYRISASAQNETPIIMGSQDNGTNVLNSSGFDRGLGGDGMDCAVDPNNDNIMFAELYYGALYKSQNGGNQFYYIAPAEDGAWVTPFCIAPGESSKMYAGYTEIYKSNNGGESWTTTTNGLSGGQTYVDVATAFQDPNRVYAVLRSKAYRTLNGGQTWNVMSSGLPASTNFSRIAFFPDDDMRAMISVSDYSSTAKVYRTRNGGVTWKNYSKTGLPSVPVNCLLLQPGSPERVFAGTDLGVYYTDSTMTVWKPFSQGLPNTVVNDLAILENPHTLRAGTYGRGLWQTRMPNEWQNNTGIRAAGTASSLGLAPNPATQSVTIRIPEMAVGGEVTLTDLQGRILRSIKMNGSSMQMDLNGISAGLYEVAVLCNKNLYRSKLVIQP
jgi:photosystem II stability/assembly factor-like uncharacterized protein